MGSKQTSPLRRKAYHAGSWYSDDEHELNQELANYLKEAEDGLNRVEGGRGGVPRAIVSPHAGFSYSGPTAAWAYVALSEAMFHHKMENNGSSLKIVVLHPSHHVYLNGCAISSADLIETPLGKLTVSSSLRNELLGLKRKGKAAFQLMSIKTDEEEHSGEMQYPFVVKVLNDVTKRASSSTNNKEINVEVLPIMVGSIGEEKEAEYGRLLSGVLARSDVFCIISSDFCHWGSRFSYNPMPTNSNVQIFEYIERLDREGMDQICLKDPGAFAKYLTKYRNTICGRHPISLWLNALHENEKVDPVQPKFVKYSQSSKVRSSWESSVSYASCVARKYE